MRRKLTETISVDELKSMYDNGMSVVDISNALEVSTATVYRYLRGQTNRRGGRCASRIPAKEFRVAEPKTKQDMADYNAMNACLVVEDRTINLVGEVGKYMVFTAKKCVLCDIAGATLELQFDAIPGLVEELKALGRNVGSLVGCCEMW